MKNTEYGEIDYMKKVKQYYARKNALGVALLFALSLIILPVIAKLHPHSENDLYYILFTVLAIGASFLLSNYQAKPESRWPVMAAAFIGVLGMLSATFLILVLYRSVQTETGLLGTELSKSGPLFNALFIAIVLIELMVFGFCAAESIRKQYAFGILPTLNLTCCSLCMSYRSILFHMDSSHTLLWAILLELKTFVLMTAGIMLVQYAVGKIRRFFEKKA